MGRPSWRLGNMPLVLGFGVAVWLVISASPAAAHASLVSTVPRAGDLIDGVPTEVEVRFDESVRLDLGAGLRVFGPDGGRVDRGSSQLRDDASTVAVAVGGSGVGTYTVAWRVVSGDAHVLSGSYIFHVQRETGAVAIVQGDRANLDRLAWLARWWILGATVVLGGLALFALFVARVEVANAIVHGTLVGISVAGLLGAVMRFMVQVAEASGRGFFDASDLWWEALTDTRAGRLDAIRAVACLVLIIFVASRQRRSVLWMGSLSALTVATTNALEGHAWTVPNNAVVVVADVVHQGAAMVWVGGLVGVALTLRRDDAIAVLTRFARTALWSVVVVAATGVISGIAQLGSVADAPLFGYGRVFFVKVAVVALMVAFGYRSQRLIADLVSRQRVLARSVGAEVVLAAVVVALTAALVGMVPARALDSRGPFSADLQDAAGVVNVTVTPARVGANTLHLYFFDPSGRPRSVDAVEVKVSLGDVPPRRITVLPVTQGHYTASSFSLPNRGRWRFAVTAAARGDVSTFDFEVKV